MGRYKSGPVDPQVAGFVRDLLKDGARQSNEIHVLCGEQYGITYQDNMAGPREILGQEIHTGLGGGEGSGRAKYLALARDVELVRESWGTRRKVKRYANPSRLSD